MPAASRSSNTTTAPLGRTLHEQRQRTSLVRQLVDRQRPFAARVERDAEHLDGTGRMGTGSQQERVRVVHSTRDGVP